MAEDEKKISKFSSGINILQRVDQLWKNCHQYKGNGHYDIWSEEWDSVWLELARDLKPEEYNNLNEKGKICQKDEKVGVEGYKSQFDKFEERLKEVLPFIDSGVIGFQQPSSEQIKKRDKQYKVLMSKQLFLARLENELGKGTSWGDSEDDWD